MPRLKRSTYGENLSSKPDSELPACITDKCKNCTGAYENYQFNFKVICKCPCHSKIQGKKSRNQVSLRSVRVVKGVVRSSKPRPYIGPDYIIEGERDPFDNG